MTPKFPKFRTTYFLSIQATAPAITLLRNWKNEWITCVANFFSLGFNYNLYFEVILPSILKFNALFRTFYTM